MDLDLKSFSLTLAVGLAFAAVLCMAQWVVDPTGVRKTLQLFSPSKEGSILLPSVMTAVLMLAVGLVCEDLSKNAIDNRNPSALAPQLAEILTSETTNRCLALILDERTHAEIDAGIPRSTCLPVNYDPEGKAMIAPVAPLGEVGVGTINVLRELVKQRVATPEESRVWEEIQPWAESNQVGSCKATSDNQGVDPETLRCVSYDVAVPKQIEQLYYVAKNTTYRTGDFFHELEGIRLRYDFERSIAFILLLGISVVSSVYLVRSTRTLWRDQGSWKAGTSLMLSLLLVVALVDVLVTPKWALIPDPVSKCQEIAANTNDSLAPHSTSHRSTTTAAKPDLTQMMAHEDAEQAYAPVCRRAISEGRNWLLVGIFLFVCMYRLRRTLPRALDWFRQSFTSTVPAPSILRVPREGEAVRALLVLSALTCTVFPIISAYQSDQMNYLLRTFAYYQVVRGADLKCNKFSAGIPSCRAPEEHSGAPSAHEKPGQEGGMDEGGD